MDGTGVQHQLHLVCSPKPVARMLQVQVVLNDEMETDTGTGPGRFYCVQVKAGLAWDAMG